MPAFAGVAAAAPPPGFRIQGEKIARKPARYSGRTAMMAHLTVFEPEPPDDRGSALAHTQEGHHGPGEPPALLPRYWAPGWNSGNALHKFQTEVNGPLEGGDVGVRLVEPRAGGRPARGLRAAARPGRGRRRGRRCRRPSNRGPASGCSCRITTSSAPAS